MQSVEWCIKHRRRSLFVWFACALMNLGMMPAEILFTYADPTWLNGLGIFANLAGGLFAAHAFKVHLPSYRTSLRIRAKLLSLPLVKNPTQAWNLCEQLEADFDLWKKQR